MSFQYVQVQFKHCSSLIKTTMIRLTENITQVTLKFIMKVKHFFRNV
jgi:hypothetical protein